MAKQIPKYACIDSVSPKNITPVMLAVIRPMIPANATVLPSSTRDSTNSSMNVATSLIIRYSTNHTAITLFTDVIGLSLVKDRASKLPSANRTCEPKIIITFNHIFSVSILVSLR